MSFLGINFFSFFSGSSNSKSEKPQPSKTEDIINKTNPFPGMPGEVVNIIVTTLDYPSVQSLSCVDIFFFNMTNRKKVELAQDFGYQGKDAMGAHQYLKALYHQIELLKDLLPQGCLAYGDRQKFDPETTLRNLQKSDADDFIKLFKIQEFYNDKCGVAVNYIVNLAKSVIFESGDLKEEILPIFYFAIRTSHTCVVELFLDHGLNIDKSNALLLACKYSRSLEMVKLLLERGANIHANVALGTTGVMNMLISFATNDGTQQKKDPATVLQIAKFLIAQGADINRPNAIGYTPLTYAALQNNIPLMKLLLENGANPNHANANLDTPLHLAVARRNHEAVSLLLEYGADKYQVGSNNESAFYKGARTGDPRLITALSLGFDPFDKI